MSNLQEKYTKELAKDLQAKLGITNTMATPKLVKIVVNMGIKDAIADKKNVEKAATVLSQITGQKAKITKAKRSIATFKLRQGDAIGAMVTLRGKRMYSFFEKVVSIVLPRLRDFRGVGRSQFDAHGNYTLGFSEYTVFPEIDASKVERMQGLEIVVVTTAKDKNEGSALLEALGMPFTKN